MGMFASHHLESRLFRRARSNWSGAAPQQTPRRGPGPARIRLSVEQLEARRVSGFLAGLNYDIPGFNPNVVAVGDFNGDGTPDLAVGSVFGNGLTVLLGNGDGTFRFGPGNALGDILALAVGDFNGDGLADLAVMRDDGVAVLLGNGDGSFQAARTVTATVGSVLVADLTGDGIEDLVVTDLNYDTVSVLLGRGDGSFQPAHTIGAALWYESVVVGDFNGDGLPDLAGAGQGSQRLGVLLGKCGRLVPAPADL